MNGSMNLRLNQQMVVALRSRVLSWLASLPAGTIVLRSFEGEDVTAAGLAQDLENETGRGRRMLRAYLQTALSLGMHELIADTGQADSR